MLQRKLTVFGLTPYRPPLWIGCLTGAFASLSILHALLIGGYAPKDEFTAFVFGLIVPAISILSYIALGFILSGSYKITSIKASVIWMGFMFFGIWAYLIFYMKEFKKP